jgi:pyridoxamine 5'-phosphate oxidase
VFERFTDRARRTIVSAQDEARVLGHDWIGTEHLLLGLLHEREGVAAKALESLEISLGAVRLEVGAMIGTGSQAPSGRVEFTPRARKVLELSLREALQLGHDYIGTEHILLGLIREHEGVAAQALVRLGADLSRVRQKVVQLLAGYPGPRDVADEPPARRNIRFPADIARLRRDYETRGLERDNLDRDPIAQFLRWYADASMAGLEEPNAMTLATVDAQGHPDARIVLLRGVDERGFVWYTNRNSTKGRELAANPSAALVFVWLSLHRQVRVLGSVSTIDDEESDEYFASRPRESQIGAWASAQSEEIAERVVLDAAVAAIAERYKGGEVPRPPHWGGYRLEHETVELWQGRANRLHDRFRYTRQGDLWRIARLSP